MKIEKLNDNQIRCTLKHSDLSSRQLKISELAYGSPKAKALFREILTQADNELGFETGDIPLMIEAIPVSTDCIVLIVTKVDDPEELDTRFSKFSPALSEDEDDIEYDDYDDDFSGLEAFSEPDDTTHDNLTASEELNIPSNDLSDNVLGLFNKVKEIIEQGSNGTIVVNTPDRIEDLPKSINKALEAHSYKPEQSDENDDSEPVVRIYSFDSLDTVITVSKAAILVYNDCNSLYKDKQHNRYYLVLKKEVSDSVSFNKVCNVMLEFGSREGTNKERINYFDEHYECICKRHAMQTLAKL